MRPAAPVEKELEPVGAEELDADLETEEADVAEEEEEAVPLEEAEEEDEELLRRYALEAEAGHQN